MAVPEDRASSPAVLSSPGTRRPTLPAIPCSTSIVFLLYGLPHDLLVFYAFLFPSEVCALFLSTRGFPFTTLLNLALSGFFKGCSSGYLET